MRPLLFRPPLFLLTGFAWLIASSILGLVLFFGLIQGFRLPASIRLVHVHTALIGGVAQMILGAMLAFIPPLLMTGRQRPESHPVLYALINLGTVGIVAGFSLNHYGLVGFSGLLVFVAFLALFVDAVGQIRSSVVSPPLNLWFYGVALLALLGGVGVGEGMAWRLFAVSFQGQARLAHIHLNLLGFVTLTIVGTMHNLFPTILNARLYSPRLAQLTFFLFPAGIVLLVGGFLALHLWVQIAAGLLILTAVLLYGYNMLRTWVDAGKPSGIASDHFLLATFFLLLVVPAGILVSVNFLWDPPAVPFGVLHLVAYTHLAFIGFMAQTIFGALSHLLPVSLAVGRVPSTKKRGPYLKALTAIVERWRALQIGALSMGTIGLGLVAALVWRFSLGSTVVHVATWITAACLFIAVAIVTAKVALLLSHRPPA